MRFFDRHPNLLKARPAVGPTPARQVASGVGHAAKLVAFVTLALVVVAAPFVYAAYRAHGFVSSGRADLAAAERSIVGLDTDAALVHLDAATASFDSAENELALLGILEPLPYIGEKISAARELLGAGTDAVENIRDVVASLGEVAAVASQSQGLLSLAGVTLPDPSKKFTEITPEEKRKILASLYDAAPKMRRAADAIDVAIARIAELYRKTPSPSLRLPLDDVRKKLVTLRDRLRVITPIAETVPAILGYPEAKHYAIFLENNTELRPTGGFLGVVGEADVKDADLAAIKIRDVYAYDGPSDALPRPVPPPPIQKYIGITKWFLRDANWSPDFQESARLMELFLKEESKAAFGVDPRVDGIIAITPQPVADVLRAIGPITVDGKTFTADNFVGELEFQVEYNFVTEGIPLAQRKDIIGDLFKEMLARVTQLSVGELLKLFHTVSRNLDEKQILLSSHEPAVQAAILERGWGGELGPIPDGADSLAYFDANLASLKSDPAVEREISYRIVPDSSGFKATAKMTYRHHGKFDKFTTRYRTYARLYVPDGAELLGVVGAMENDKLKDPRRRPGTVDVLHEFGRTAFGAFISIEPGETRSLEFSYRLPKAVADAIRAGQYRLLAAKQPGTIGHRLTLDLDFGKKLKSAAPAEQPKNFGDSRYSLDSDLRMDRLFEAVFP